MREAAWTAAREILVQALKAGDGKSAEQLSIARG
jgi:hypothetical protein